MNTRILNKLLLPPGLFRLSLAAAVLISHLSRFDIGRLAVLLFFFLSGYWTSKIYAQKFFDKNQIHFYLSRFLRIYPLYIIATIFSSVVLSLPMHFENYTLLGVASTGRDPTGVSWSLDVELQYYLLIPLIIPMLRRTTPIILASMLLGAFGCWLATHLHLVLVLKYIPAFVLGALTDRTKWRPSALTSGLSALAFAGMTVITAFTPFLDKNSPHPFDEDIWSFFWMLPLLPYVAGSLNVKSGKLDRHAGNISFPLYLFHYTVIAFSRDHVGSSALIKAGALTLSVLLAAVVYLAVDRPLDGLRVRLTEKPLNRRPPTAGAKA